MHAQLTRAQSETLTRELAAIEAGPHDEAHIEFKLAYDAVRRRHMLNASDRQGDPQAAAAIREATDITRHDFPGFSPEIPSEPPATIQLDRVEPPDGLIASMLTALHIKESTDSTALKWSLMGDKTRQELRRKYEQQVGHMSLAELMQAFKTEVDEIHNRRGPQQEQRRALGPDAIE